MVPQGIKKAVFIGAHTDDEVICAGSLRKLQKAGAEVSMIHFSIASPENKIQKFIVEKEYEKAMEILGISPRNRFLVDWGDDLLANRRDDIRQVVYDYVEKEKPEVVFLLSRYDEHQSHQAVGEESERVMRGRVPLVIRCPYPWNYKSFQPNLYVSLSEDEIKTKIDLISAYKSQQFRYRYPELFAYYAKADGLSVKVEYAEKFEIVRFLW